MGRAKSRIPGRDLGSCSRLSLERLPEEARGRAASGWGLSAPGGAELGGGWQPSEVPVCQRAQFDFWRGEALGSGPVPRVGVWVNGNREVCVWRDLFPPWRNFSDGRVDKLGVK